MTRLPKSRRIYLMVAVAFVLGGLVSALLGLLVPPPVLRDDMQPRPAVDEALLAPTNHPYGFYDAERTGDGITYRWTAARATYTFPYAAYMGRNADVAVRMTVAGAPPGYTATVKLLLNGQQVEQTTVAGVYNVYTAHIDTHQTPSPYLEPAHVQLDIESTTFRSQADGRVLGVNVDWVELRPERSRTDIAVEALVWAVLLAAVMLVTMVKQRSVRWAAVFALGALATFVALHLTYLPRGVPPAAEVTLAGLGWLLAVWLTPRSAPAWGLVLALLGLWVVLAGRLLGEWQLDDAYITYRYASNLAHGSGPIYNPGEVVEGYTNFLWMLLSTVAIGLHLSPAAVTLAANIGLNMLLIALTWQQGATLSGRRYVWPALACALLSIDTAVITYGARGSGMEAMLFSVLVMLAASLIFGGGARGTGQYVIGGLVLALATLTRPEGLLVAGVFVSVRALQQWRLRRTGRTVLLYGGVPFLLVLVPYEIWRVAYYGYPLPNTFYAKTGASLALVARGWDYLVVFRYEHWLPVALAILGAVIFTLRWRTSGVLTALAAYAVLQTAYVVWIGGDHFPGWRFLLPICAPMVLLAQEAARRTARFLPSNGRVRVVVGALALLAVLVYASDAVWLEESTGVLQYLTQLHTAYVERWGSAGLWLRENTPPGTVTAAKGAGAIAYYGQRPTIDMFGLTDLHIGHLDIPDMGERNAGHDKTDPAYVLSRRPAYILSEWAGYFDPLGPALKQAYTPRTVLSPTGVPTDWYVLNDTAR